MSHSETIEDFAVARADAPANDDVALDVDGALHEWISPTVTVVIPTLNEAGNLPHILPRIDPGHEIVLVDGGSTDDTVEVARRLRPDVRVLRQNRSGKGNALICGWNAASGDIVVTLDADGSALPEEIPLFVAALVDGADYAKGSRYLDGGGSTDLTILRSSGNRFLGATVNALFRTDYTDLCYGYNAFWRRCVDDLACDADGFEIETLMNIRAAQRGLTIVEVPSVEADRIVGDSNLRPFRDGFRILGLIVRERLGLGRDADPVAQGHPAEALAK